jgi:hypothetical protein
MTALSGGSCRNLSVGLGASSPAHQRHIVPGGNRCLHGCASQEGLMKVVHSTVMDRALGGAKDRMHSGCLGRGLPHGLFHWGPLGSQTPTSCIPRDAELSGVHGT